MYRCLGKRVFDVSVAVSILVVAALPMLGVALLIRAKMGAPVLYRHKRTGMSGAPFEMLKFRTMDLQIPGHERPSSARITTLGRTLRSLSLDELPQLVNVIRGDMSLVGPRPLLPDYDSLYSDEQRRRFEVRPGITGLAQVSGRSRLAWGKKFAFDVTYVDELSLATDVKILMATARRLLDRSSTVADGSAIQERFDGTN